MKPLIATVLGVLRTGRPENRLATGARGACRCGKRSTRDVPPAPALARAAADDVLRDVHGPSAEGIEKWTADTARMTMMFYDKAGREMLVEQIS